MVFSLTFRFRLMILTFFDVALLSNGREELDLKFFSHAHGGVGCGASCGAPTRFRTMRSENYGKLRFVVLYGFCSLSFFARYSRPRRWMDERHSLGSSLAHPPASYRRVALRQLFGLLDDFKFHTSITNPQVGCAVQRFLIAQGTSSLI